MVRVVRLIISPFDEWQRISEQSRGALAVLLLFLLPVMAVSFGVEAYVLATIGEKRGFYSPIGRVDPELVLRYTSACVVLGLTVILMGAYFLHSVAVSFNLKANFSTTFSTLAHGMSPIFLAHLADAIPGVPTWICFAGGAALTCGALYHGVAQMLKPEQTKGFGLYLFTLVYVLLASGLSHFVATSILQGKLFNPASLALAWL